MSGQLLNIAVYRKLRLRERNVKYLANALYVHTYIHKSLDMYSTRNIITRLEVVVDSVKDYLL